MRNQVSISSIVIVLLVSLLSAGSAFGLTITSTSPQLGTIQANTNYDLLLGGLVPNAVSDGILTVTEHWGDFNNNGQAVGTVVQDEWVNIWLNGFSSLNLTGVAFTGTGSPVVSSPKTVLNNTEILYFQDNEANTRDVTLTFTISQNDLNNIILAGGTSTYAHVYTSPDVDKVLQGSWFQATLEYEVIPEPATMMLFGLGGVLLRRSIRRRKA
ncbi:MAG: PEP-CTERM sorting domain-containing protein [Sedimentisphaerales bacterium]|nr:PEP-CTERM sorting domain-containing protein [Sedimentisphaerales bacterium]